MYRKIRNPALWLAVILQAAPLSRPLVTAPSSLPSFAIIFRWFAGTAAALGAYDAVSGATAVYFTTPTNFTGQVGSFFSNYVAIANNGGDPGAFFVLTNSSGISPSLKNGNTTTNCMPPGLTFKCVDPNNGGSPQLIYGAMFGTPTTAVTNHRIHVLVGYPGQTPAETNIWLTFTQSTGIKPVITNQPVGLTNVAGAPASLSVLAGGTAPLKYQWRLFSTNNLPTGTNATFSFTNLRLSDIGDYSVVITNNFGSVTSGVAHVEVTRPPPPRMSAAQGGPTQFRLSFIPVVGLTNSVETNSAVGAGVWGTFTNIPPPASASSITVTDTISGTARFYRLSIKP
jgi:hypothetical protein